MNVSVVIATMNREEELRQCLNSIKRQTYLPKEIIIVDDGNLNQHDIAKSIPEDIDFKYHKKNEPSLSKSRNIGAKLAESQLLLFLDDDVVLEPNYIKEIIKVFKSDLHAKIAGVSGIIINREEKPSFLKLWERAFLLSLGKPGVILPWGFYTKIDRINEVIQTDWIPGGLSCFRKEVFEYFQLYDFKDFGHKGGRHGLADVEFSLRIREKYKLVVTPHAKLYHYRPKATKVRSYNVGYKQAFNQGVLFAKYCKKSVFNYICFIWALIGLILGNLGAVFLVKDKQSKEERLYRALGNLRGVLSFALNR